MSYQLPKIFAREGGKRVRYCPPEASETDVYYIITGDKEHGFVAHHLTLPIFSGPHRIKDDALRSLYETLNN